jgi:hypothetical protein
MTELVISCPQCKAEIKLTESLAAPLIESTRRDYDKLLAEKDAEVAKRTAALQEQETAIAKAKAEIEQTIENKIQTERAKIVADENQKAKRAAALEVDQKVKEIEDLKVALDQRNEKLAVAQKEQAELMRKQRALDDEKRELELTIEKRIQDSRAAVLEQARKEMEEQLSLKISEKDQSIASMQRQIEDLKLKETDISKKEAALLEREAALLKTKASIDEEVAEKLKQEQGKIAADEARKAKLALSNEIDQKDRENAELTELLKQREEKLAEAQKAQADLLSKQRALDDEKRELELTVEKRVQAGLDATRSQARKEAEEQLNLKVMEKEQTIVAMQKQIEELKRKSEQGSQQLQGEVQELAIEALLGAKFPRDTIEPVPKGEHGGDILQRVCGPVGQVCGTILWESKRTKNWSDGWLSKLRDDQRTAKADIAIIVSQALPNGVESFDLIDGVWVADPKTALPVAIMLRNSLIEISLARQASEGLQTKTEMVYQYLTGPRFKQRVEAIVEAFSSMQSDLDKERKAIMKQWAKREEQIERVMGATVGMYGDLQGIAGKSLQEIEGLEMKALE